MTEPTKPILYQYTGETRHLKIDLNLEDELVAGEVLQTLNSVTATPSGLTIANEALGTAGDVGKILVDITSPAATENTTFIVRPNVTTDNASIITSPVVLQVLD